jgi:hypothetical protein
MSHFVRRSLTIYRERDMLQRAWNPKRREAKKKSEKGHGPAGQPGHLADIRTIVSATAFGANGNKRPNP